MEFNLRAISLAESIKADARCVVSDFLGKKISFRAGISIELTLPDEPERFQFMPEPERLLTALDNWNRVYRHPEDGCDSIHILATADDPSHGIVFYRIDLRQHPPPSRRTPRPMVEITGGAILDYEECANWLIEHSFKLSADPDRATRPSLLSRPRRLKTRPIRIAWIGPEVADGVSMQSRLQAIGAVYGAQFVQIPPRSYRDAEARLNGALPLDAVIICGDYAPYITVAAVPQQVRASLVHICNSRSRYDLEAQIKAWTEVALEETERESGAASGDQISMLLSIMLRGMLSHSKIGQFKHCSKETVLTGVRARHLNVTTAEGILDQNSEAFQETKNSDALFLHKAHNDGRQYFLNSQQMVKIKTLVDAGARAARS
jgi:hypothetical protein